MFQSVKKMLVEISCATTRKHQLHSIWNVDINNDVPLGDAWQEIAQTSRDCLCHGVSHTIFINGNRNPKR
jgi:hypothetical protein